MWSGAAFNGAAFHSRVCTTCRERWTDCKTARHYCWKQEKIEQVQSFLYSAYLLHAALKIAVNDNDSKLTPIEFTTTFSESLWNRSSSFNPSVSGPSFYTHPFGCKLSIRFNIFRSCRRDAIMHIISCEGEYDWLQLWPVPCTITAQILTHAGQEKEYIDWKVKLSLTHNGTGCCLTNGNRGLEISRYDFSYRQHDNKNRYLTVRIGVK